MSSSAGRLFMIFGISLGLVAAVGQALSYVFSRAFVARHHGQSVRLLLLSHVIMGVLAVLVSPFFWPAQWPTLRQVVGPLAGCTVFYFISQGLLIFTLRRIDASRVSPMLGLKLVLLALISTFFLGKHLSAPQWLAVALAVAAALMLNGSGGSLGWRALSLILLVCTGYCLSDINAYRVNALFIPSMGLLRGCSFSVCLNYTTLGLFSLAVLALQPRSPRGLWLHAAPVALSWLGAMYFLFSCFSLIGVMYGNIVQSTRGLISILIGAGLAMAGHEHLERRVPPAILRRRLFAALLMIGAVVLYSWH